MTHQLESVGIYFTLLDIDDMHLSKGEESKTKSLGITNFTYGSFPVNENEICINEKYLNVLNISTDLLKQEQEIIISVANKEYKLAGVISPVGLLSDAGLMVKSSYSGETSLHHVKFSADSTQGKSFIKNSLINEGIVLDVNPDDGLISNFMFIIEFVLIFLAITITIITFLMYYSNFKALLKECEEQVCLNYYLGCTKENTTRDMLFKICFIGTLAFIIGTVLASLFGIWINNQKSLVFGGMPLYSIAMPDFLGVLIGYFLAIGLLILIFNRPIRKTMLKLPNSFGGNI